MPQQKSSAGEGNTTNTLLFICFSLLILPRCTSTQKDRCVLLPLSCGDCVTSHRFHGQRSDRHDVLDGHRSQHRAKVECLYCQVVGLHRCKVVISDVQHVLQKKAKSHHPVRPCTA